jgi:hypothetical protein
MFNLSRAMQAIDAAIADRAPSGLELTWNTPVQFDADLPRQLIAQYDELNARFDVLSRRLAVDPEMGERAVLECADRLHKLRHIESLKLYPVIARGLSPDPIARRLFWQSRLVTLGLARRVLRRFDELARAVRAQSEIALAAEHVSSALAEYRRRNESTMFPLYLAVGRRADAVRARAG